MSILIEERKKSVVFLRKEDVKGEIVFNATGFFLRIEEIFLLATAKHVIINPDTKELMDEGMIVSFNLKADGIEDRSLDKVKEKFDVEWIFHENDNVDIAIIPFGIDKQEDDVKVISDDFFLNIEEIFELYDVFFLSFQPGVPPQQRIIPIIRTGTISLINDDKTFYIDGFTFPGNSGSPVFLKPSAVRFDKIGNFNIGKDKIGGSFLGIIGEYIPYQEVAYSKQTGRPRVVFEENTGLSKVWSVKFLEEIFKTKAFKEQIKKIKDNSKSNSI